MKTQKPYLDEQTGERFAEPPSPLPLYLVYLPESNEDDLLSSVQAANFIERELRDGFVAGHASRDAEVAELREAYENWKSNGQAMHAALLEIWHSVTAWDTSDMTFGDDPQSVVKAVRESASAEVAELKAKIADAWDEGREAEQKFRELKLYRRATNPYRSATSPAAEVSGNPQ